MEKPNKQIIQNFINNCCSSDEHKHMMQYLNSLDDDELNNFLDLHIKQVSEMNLSAKNSSSGNFRAILKSIQQNNSRSAFSRRNYIYSIAASVAFILVLSLAAFYFLGVFNNNSNEINWAENITQNGQKIILSLPDGSSITLNGNSRLKYPQKFEAQIRDVYLEGEAFFNIAHDSSKPFVVHTKNISTTVLGTKFNVHAFSNSDEISVSLVEGTVKVTNKEKNGVKGNIILKPNQKLVYNLDNDISEVKGFDYLQEIGWKDNILVFNDEPLEKVFTRLEIAYGIKFELNNKAYEKIKITTKFENSTLTTVNEVIKKLTGLDYKTIAAKNIITKVIFYNNKDVERRK